MRKLSAEQVRWLRVRAQGLAGGGAASVHDVVQRAAALQAQAGGAVRVQVWARAGRVGAGRVGAGRVGAGRVRAADVGAAVADGTVVRTWLMRSTIHAVVTEDLRPMLAVLGPVNLRAGRRRREQLGLTAELCDRAMDALPRILGGGRALTRAELVGELTDYGVVLDLKTQQPPHLFAYASNSALICRGPDAPRDEPTYVLLDEWIPPGSAPAPDEALALLANRYYAAYGPASTADFAAWSGLPVADVKKATELIRDTLTEVEFEGSRLLLPRDVAAAELEPPTARHRLLGRFDPYLLGHRSRDLILDPAFAKRVNAGGGMIAQTMLAEGRIVGTWTAGTLEPFGKLSSEDDEAFRNEMSEYLKWSETPA